MPVNSVNLINNSMSFLFKKIRKLNWIIEWTYNIPLYFEKLNADEITMIIDIMNLENHVKYKNKLSSSFRLGHPTMENASYCLFVWDCDLNDNLWYFFLFLKLVGLFSVYCSILHNKIHFKCFCMVHPFT